jgi:hypothetical protein
MVCFTVYYCKYTLSNKKELIVKIIFTLQHLIFAYILSMVRPLDHTGAQ